MHAQVLPRLLFFLVLVFAFLTTQEAASQQTASPAPIIEVVAFGVAPVADVDGRRDLQPRKDDILHRIGGGIGRSGGRDGDVELRTMAGENWLDLLLRAGRDLVDRMPEIAALAPQLQLLPGLLPGKYVRFRVNAAKGGVQIDYVVRPEEVYSILLTPGSVQVEPKASDPRIVERMRADPSKASLFTATDAIGLPEDIALQLAEIFSDNVDFHRELHHGYRCVIVYEVLYRDGHIERPGRILAAEITIRNRRLQAFYYDGGSSGGAYFNEDGASLKRLFRKSPVEFSRITSHYTLARFLAIIGRWRAHRGIDYAAPIGTKVLATADGVVEFMGARGEYGNLLILNHSDKFMTYYGHLAGFARDLVAGSKVTKGQTIGFVGVTGLTTGPHLHYEFRVNNGAGQWVPVPPPDVIEVPPLTTPAYFQAVQTLQGQFQVAQQAHFVILD
jgi:murein DD-endopeptidase MepM/ murein hydrolase activator NlpD